MTEPAAERPKRLTLSAIVELLLSRHDGERSSVTLACDSRGDTAIEVKVRTGDDGDVLTADDAARKAREVLDRLRAAYPPSAGHDNATVSLARNAKGETQIETTIRTGDGGPRTLDEASTAARDTYERLRSRYPMANGLSAKPGSVA
jgi:hypothetical protein